jgi:protein-tyrosine phosphatase
MTQDQREYTEQTPYGKLHIHRGEPRDVEATLALYETADAWMRSRGIDPGKPPISLRDIVAGRITDEVIWLAHDAGANNTEALPLGAIVLLWEDLGIWSSMPDIRTDEALYVHGLVSSRRPEGRGVGLRLLRWAEQVTANAGRAYLRLSCMATNPVLRGYYQRAGFTYRGDFAGSDITLSRYEKRIDDGGWP